MKLDQMALTLGKFSSVFPHHSLSPESIRLWYEMFSNETIEHFYAAMSAVIKESDRKFFPTPGEVSGSLRLLKTGHSKPASEIWEDLSKLAQFGKTDTDAALFLQGNTPAINALAQIGGFKVLRFGDIEHELPFRKRDFIQYYEDAIAEHDEVERIENGHNIAVKVLNHNETKKLTS